MEEAAAEDVENAGVDAVLWVGTAGRVTGRGGGTGRDEDEREGGDVKQAMICGRVSIRERLIAHARRKSGIIIGARV